MFCKAELSASLDYFFWLIYFILILFYKCERTLGNENLIPYDIEDFMMKLGEDYQLSAENWFLRKKDGDDKQDPHLVFNVLDGMLKDSLDRLKMMK